jgi:hypothetical protein
MILGFFPERPPLLPGCPSVSAPEKPIGYAPYYPIVIFVSGSNIRFQVGKQLYITTHRNSVKGNILIKAAHR